ncbi:MAG: inositol 2-dehydrogenase [Thermomicrobiales bacterium]|nr:inositol 2-dehydrogenase [Thermomicrobiales bacterium]
MTTRPRIALIGCGRIGQVHARNLASLRELCDFAIAADFFLEAAEKTASAYGVPRAMSDGEAAIADPEIDAVIIASSTETHAPYIELASHYGKSIFTEKPIALDLDATDRALTAADSAGVRLQVGFQRRFDPGYVAAKNAILNGELGAVEMIHDVMRDPQPPPAAYIAQSGGLYRDMAIHNFDSVRWLMGEDPIEIFVMAGALFSDDIRAANDVDTSVVTLRFPSGAIATIENSRRSGFGYDVRTEIFGSGGGLMVGESRDLPIRRYTSAGVIEDHQYFFLERFRDAYRQEMISFLTAIGEDAAVSVTGEDGRTALRLAMAAEESLRQGRPVSLLPTEVLHAQS